MNTRILFTDENNHVFVIVPADNCPLSIEEIAEKDVPKGFDYVISDTKKIPADRFFRNAWRINDDNVVEDLQESKKLTHIARRAAREVEFKPFDEIISKQIPDKDAQQAELQRQKIRDKYASKQIAIDASDTTDKLRVYMREFYTLLNAPM